MNPRSLATQFRNLPRSAALTRPARKPLTVPRYSPASAFRSYSDASESSTASAEGAAKTAEVQAAEEKAAALEAKIKELERDVLYHRAEIQTLNRRIADEKAKASEFAITSFARNLLSTSDVLTKALSHVKTPISPDNPDLHNLYSGVELTHKAMLKTFEQHGVKKMEVERGGSFDPNMHEATFQIPKEAAGPKGDGEWGPGEVVEVGKEGWTIGNRVLRPAQVGVTQI
ncbi:GrpE-domain-containing protein, partial [Naematelia encephala]